MKNAVKNQTALLEELEQLREENARLKALQNALPSASKLEEQLLLLDTISTHVFYLSDPYTYGMVNKAHADFFGVEKSDLEYKNLHDILDENESKVCVEGNERIFMGKKPIATEEILKNADGEERLFAFKKKPKLDPKGEVEYVVCTGEDITERKNADRLLTFTQFTIDQAKIGIFWCHADGSFFYANKTACNWLMYSFDELKQMHVADINPEFPRDAWEGHWQDIKAKGLVHMESYHRRKNGEVYPVELYSNYVQFEGEEYKLSFVSDISEKRHARDALKASQFFLANIIESIQDGVSVLDRDLNIVHTNAVMREWYQGSGELIGKKCFEAYHGSARNCDPCPTKKALATGNTESEIIPGPPNAPETTFEVFSYPLKDRETKKITGVVEFVRDISDRVKLERQLLQAQKMEAIGTLAGGMAHDFNNLLLGIQGRVSLVAVDLPPSDPRLEHLEAIEAYIQSASDLTKQLLGVARGGKYAPKAIDLNSLVVNSSTMFGRTRKQIKIKTKISPSEVVVDAEKKQIEQVLLNMFVNASQAMPDGGKLFLETSVVTFDEAYCKPFNAKPGRYAKISITDTGIGMDDATRQQIFDPFFTTKDKGRGTGLGLASAYGIINNHKGFITTYSEVGHGTTFNINLPVSEKEVHREAPKDGRILRGSETILLVDDEEIVIEVGQGMLDILGYRVLAALGGKKAIDIVKTRGDQIDLIILDLIMPGLDGGKTFDRIRALLPDIPVILSSGYAINGQATDIMRRGCNGFIQKPFNLSELSQVIRKIVDDPNR